MTSLNLLAVQNSALLRQLRTAGLGGAPATISLLAAAIGRDPSNISRSLKALQADGLVRASFADGLTLAGEAQLEMLDRADGQDDKPGSSPNFAGILSLRHDQILPDPDNARKDWDSEEAEAELDALRVDIVKNGLLQNLVVREMAEDDLQPRTVTVSGSDGQPADLPVYRLVAGERRWRAIGIAVTDGDWDLDTPIMARLLSADAKELRFAAIAENLLRRKLNPIEKATGFEQLAEIGFDNKAMAERLGFTPEHVQQHRRFLKLDADDQQRMTLNRDDPRHLSVRDARQKLALKDKASAPPPTIAVSPVARLVLAEVVHAIIRRAAYHYGDFEVGPEALSNIHVRELIEAGELRPVALRTYGDFAGRYVLQAGYNLTWAAFPLMRGTDKADQDEGLRQEQAAFAETAGVDVPATPGEPYLTPWLNGPFEITSEGQAALDERAAEEADREAMIARNIADRDAAAARGRAAAERARALFDARQAAAPSAEDMAAVAAEADAPLPWRLSSTGDAVAADGAVIIKNGGSAHSEARLRLMVLSINAAADIDTPDDDPAPEPEPAPTDLDEEAFVMAMADALTADDQNIDGDEALEKATTMLAADLADNGIAFGAEGWVWTADGAAELVAHHLAAEAEAA